MLNTVLMQLLISIIKVSLAAKCKSPSQKVKFEIFIFLHFFYLILIYFFIIGFSHIWSTMSKNSPKYQQGRFYKTEENLAANWTGETLNNFMKELNYEHEKMNKQVLLGKSGTKYSQQCLKIFRINLLLNNSECHSN